MKRVLVAIPYKPDLHDHLYHRMIELSDALIWGNPDYQIDIMRVCEKFVFTGKEPYAHPQATVRNALLDKFLKPEHDLVMWIDADMVDYPADIITQLDRANPGGVTAPIVLVEGSNQFYDTYGYVQEGKKVRPWPPYFFPSQDRRLITMDAVGCAYLIPAEVYRNGRYTTTPEHTEHMSICRLAGALGLPIMCYTEMVIYHADLPRYGLNWHGH
jgi:hypothetical protein